MSTNSPQDLLQQLDDIGISGLYADGFTPEERAARIKLARQKVKHVVRLLNREEQNIKDRWDGRNEAEAENEKRQLAPYLVIGDLISQIEITLSELEIATQEGTALPSRFVFGDILDEERFAGQTTYRITTAETLEREEQERQQRLEVERRREVAFAAQMQQEQRERLSKAAELAKAGYRQEAAELVAQVIEIDRNNADAWYMVGYLADTMEQRVDALKFALKIDPGHENALQALDTLDDRLTQKLETLQAQKQEILEEKQEAEEQEQRRNRLRKLTIALAFVVVLTIVGLLILFRQPSSEQPLPTVARLPTVTSTVPNAGIQNLPTNTPSKQ